MSVWRFAEGIHDVPAASRLSLGEGDTPLLPSRSIGPASGIPNLWFKLETSNPTGSYKDRFAAVAVSDMVAHKKHDCIATSSGNTGSSLAAYCAAAKIRCRIAIVEQAPQGKLLQMQAYGAELVRIRGFGTDADITNHVFQRLQSLAQQPQSALQISGFKFSPVGMSGVRTLAYELIEQVPGDVHDVFCPAGGGGLVLAVAQGFEWAAQGIRRSPPARVHCVQPIGNSTIAGPLRAGADRARAVACTTAISGLQVASVVDGDEVIAACRRCGGMGFEVADDEVWTLQQRLAREEGLFCEPAAATALAGALQAVRNREVNPRGNLVCVITGSGFKDSPSLEKMAGPPSPLRDAVDLGW